MSAPVTHPAPAAVDEAARLLREAVTVTDPDLAAYDAGMVTGYLVAFGLVDDTERAVARATFHARPVPFDDVQPPVTAAESRQFIYRASGLMFGFHQATSERMDAVECAGCGDRVLIEADDEARECPDHGWVCGDDCRRTACDLRSRTCNEEAAGAL